MSVFHQTQTCCCASTINTKTNGLGTFSQFRPFNSFPFLPTCIFLVVDSVSKSCLSSTGPKPAAAPLPSTQKRTRKKLKLEARCNAEQSIIFTVCGNRQTAAAAACGFTRYARRNRHNQDYYTERHGVPCTNSRPRARWYQLRRIPLVGSESVFPQCYSLFVIARGSPKPSALGFPVHISKAHLKRKRESGTAATVMFPTVKCPMVRPQRYSTLQKPSRATSHKFAQTEYL